MRSRARTILSKIKPLPNYVQKEVKHSRIINYVKKVKDLEDRVTADYTNIMAYISQMCIQIMGQTPCKYALVGMGSLARKETTPY